MPMYEYKCAKCGAVKTVIQKIGDKPPKCCRKAMVKQVSTGTGFHVMGGERRFS